MSENGHIRGPAIRSTATSSIRIDPSVFGFHYAAISYTALALAVLVPVATFVLLVSALVPRLRQRPWLYAAFLITNAIIGAIVFLDPHSFFLWFMD